MTEHTPSHTGFALTGNQLKIIAMIAMLIDHIAVQFFPHLLLLRIPGRISFPIFAYMIAEGCRYTRNRTRYLLQLAGLGIGCQLVFTLTTGALYLGILITFSLAVLTIYTMDALLTEKSAVRCVPLYLILSAVFFVTVLLPLLLPASLSYELDYGVVGVLLPVLLYYAPRKWLKLLCMAVLLTLHALLYDWVKWFALLSIPLLALYNGKRGRYQLKYRFYIFYPTHLALIYLVALLMQM